MFTVKEDKFGDFAEYIIRNPDTGESLTVNKPGANIRYLVLRSGRAVPTVQGYWAHGELAEGRWSRGIKMMPFPN